MAERVSRRQRAQPRGPGVTPVREAAHEAEPINPILALQRTIGNQATQRLLMRRSESSEAWVTRNLRRLLADIDRAIQHDFASIFPELWELPGREEFLPLVRNVKRIHQATGILSIEMISTLRQAFLRLKPDRTESEINERHVLSTLISLDMMVKHVQLKAEVIQVLNSDDELGRYKWYLGFLTNTDLDRLGAKSVGHEFDPHR